jgi:hypothetical protein
MSTIQPSKWSKNSFELDVLEYLAVIYLVIYVVGFFCLCCLCCFRNYTNNRGRLVTHVNQLTSTSLYGNWVRIDNLPNDYENLCAICRRNLYSNPPLEPNQTFETVEKGENIEDLFVSTPVVLLPCSHCFHEICVKQWVIDHKNCPVCRYDLESSSSGLPLENV